MNKTMAKILLLSCCAPCSCAVIQKFAEEKKDFAVLFYNPNIHPLQEYLKRKEENEKFCNSLGVPFISLEYNPQEWLNAVKGLENEPERGKRCSACFLIRLRRAADYAAKNGFDTLTSVLGVSRYKNLEQVNMAAKTAADEFGIVYDDTNWRKGGLEQKRQQIVKETEMYAQNYCGCTFSMSRLQSRS